jgi:hypothetical protein
VAQDGSFHEQNADRGRSSRREEPDQAGHDLMKSVAICPGEVSLHQMASQFHLVLFEDGLEEEGASML